MAYDVNGTDDAPFANDVDERVHRVPPNALDAERAVLGNILRDGDRLSNASPLRPDDFCTDSHERIFHAFLVLREAQRDVGPITVRDCLDATGRLMQIGGAEYLAELAERAPIISAKQFAECVRLVLEKSRARQAIRIAQRVESMAYAGSDACQVVAAAIDDLSKLTETSTSARPSLDARVQAWRDETDLERLTLGYPTLDTACRGGFAPPRLVVVGGAPGAGKTALVINAAVRAARIGHPVAILAADEDVDDELQRIGQLDGIDRWGLERRQPDAIESLRGALGKIANLEIFDGDDDTIESAFAWLKSHPVDGKPGVLVCDSAQTARTERSESLASPRERVDDLVRTIKRATRELRLVSFVTSEIGRAFYRNEKNLEDLNDLAAFKESGGIEYAAKTCLLMRSVKDSPDLFNVGMPKNRGGAKRVFRLRIDLASTELSETIIPPDDEPDADPQRRKVDTKVETDANAVYSIIAANPGIGSKQLRDKSRLGPPALGRAVEALKDAKRIRNEPERHGQREDAHYFATEGGQS